MPTLPSALFHYTSINNLALILQSKSIRFGRLDKVNDPTEGHSSDFHSMAPYIFITSWTANEAEDLALWNMYTPLMHGVRIELPLPLFPNYTITHDTGEKVTSKSLVSQTDYIDYSKGYLIVGAENTLNEIIYTDDLNLLQPSIRRVGGLHMKSLSSHKRLMWKIEKEYRYQLNIIPFEPNITPLEVANSSSRLIAKQHLLPFEGYIVKIRKKAFEEMKIRLSPKLDDGERAIIRALVKCYNPKAVIEDSTITGLIR